MLPVVEVTEHLPLWATMANSIAMEHFLTFAKEEHSEENLLFWLDVEAMRSITQPKQLGDKAGAIWKTYFQNDSKLALTIDGDTIDALKGKFERAVFGPFLFAKAQKLIGDVLVKDVHSRFIGGDEYQKLVRHLATLLNVLVTRSNGQLSLHEVLSNPLSYDYFRKHLQSKHLADVLLFYSCIDAFKRRKMADFELKQYAEFLCRHFLTADPVRVSCLEQKVQQEVLTIVSGGGRVKAGLFNGIQEECLVHMRKHFDSFRASAEYDELLSKTKAMTDQAQAAAPALDHKEQKDALYAVGPSSTTVTNASERKNSQSMSTSRVGRMPIGEVLNNVKLLEAFLQFAQAENDDNALMFWMEADHHRHLPPDRLVPKAYSLFKKFLKPNAEKHVPVEKEVIERIRQKLLKKDAANVFDEVQAAVERYLEQQDIFSRFVQSQEYAAIASELAEQAKQKDGCCMIC